MHSKEQMKIKDFYTIVNRRIPYNSPSFGRRD